MICFYFSSFLPSFSPHISSTELEFKNINNLQKKCISQFCILISDVCRMLQYIHRMILTMVCPKVNRQNEKIFSPKKFPLISSTELYFKNINNLHKKMQFQNSIFSILMFCCV